MEILSKEKNKIAIVGIGGVGGYYGGLLSRYAETHSDVTVSFLSRGAHMLAMQEKGLTVITETETFLTHPARVTDHAEEIGEVDYLVLAIKSYDLDTTIEQIRPMVGQKTVILPLLNGVDNTARLRKSFPGNEVWWGGVYIITRLNAPGEVESSGNVHYFHFGHEKARSSRLLYFEKLLIDAGIEATLKDDPVKAIWRKFFYISTTAALTTYLNTGFRDLVWDTDKKPMYLQLMQELYAVSESENIGLPLGIIDEMLMYGGSLPAGTTSSMNTDFLAGKPIELETLLGEVIRIARKNGVETPLYISIYEDLKSKIKANNC